MAQKNTHEKQKFNLSETFMFQHPIMRRILGKKKIEDFNWDKFEANVKVDHVNGVDKRVAAEIENLVLYFTNPSRPGERNLVIRGTSLKLYEGEVHAIIGESGSGKSVICSTLFGLTGDNSVIDSGKVMLYNNEVQDFSQAKWESSRYRGKVVSAVFQNAMSTLNPTMKIGKQIMEGMLINGIETDKKKAYEKALYFLELTKIADPQAVMDLYPHELSGGMMQRVVIAAIVSLKPKVLIMDEPTTALDPTVQALVLDVVRDLQKQFKISVLFITHDLGVVASIADRISIMYAGQVVETGTREEILEYPLHPYTWGLISSMPDVNQGTRLRTIRGNVPSNLNKIEGDAFAVRNDYALDVDFEHEPPMVAFSPTHEVRSWLYMNKMDARIDAPQLISDKWEKHALGHPQDLLKDGLTPVYDFYMPKAVVNSQFSEEELSKIELRNQEFKNKPANTGENTAERNANKKQTRKLKLASKTDEVTANEEQTQKAEASSETSAEENTNTEATTSNESANTNTDEANKTKETKKGTQEE